MPPPPVASSSGLPAGWQLRAMTAADIDAVMAIERRASPDPWRRYAFEQSLAPDSAQLLADQRGAAVGFLIWRVVADQAELLNIALLPEWRGHGLGRALLVALLEQLPAAVSSMFLEVRASNFAAIGLYTAIGFNQIGERRDYYRRSDDPLAGREDALVMALDTGLLSR